ncbi:MAG: ASPIC/UnbV domain-containing protein, partial [bacterium]|nr:ASPIC/UnbV domain-containing protein [bacterium]
RNDIEAGSWLEVRPVATASNSSLRGVRVVAHWQGKSQIQDYDYGAGYWPEGGSSSKLFGMGTATFADSIVVYWPSGSVSVNRNVPANSVLEVAESPGLSLLAVSDVPNDQGGVINVKFSAMTGGLPDGGGLLLAHEAQKWDSGTWLRASIAPRY